jgi:D-3-phosphoglycerate dehydrogenase
VLVGPSSFAESDPAARLALLDAGFDVIDNPYRRRLTRDELLALLTPDVVGLVAGLEPLDRAVLEQSALRVVSRCGSGLSNVDVAAARELGIAVRSTPDAPVDAVAELTIGALLALLRGLAPMSDALHERRWEKLTGGQLGGRTVAVVGCGRIGVRVAELLASFRARVLGVDRSPPRELPFPIVPLEEALAQADVVTLHVSGEGEVIGAAEIARMKRGAILLNASRGGVVDEAALAAALADGGCLMVNRNAGSGTRILIDRLLGDAKPPGYWVQPKTHSAVAVAVAQGRADWGIAIATVARQYELDFIPIQEEHYDFVVPRTRREREPVRRFLALLDDASVRAALAALGFRL